MQGSWVLGVAIALAATTAAIAAEDRAPAPACTAAPAPDRLAALTPEGDLVFAAAGRARLAAIRLPARAPWREKALAWLRERIGQPLSVAGGPERDRWGRRAVQARLAAPADADLAGGLVDEGLALVDAGAVTPFCRPELLSREERARKANLGLWADAHYKPLDADTIGRLQDRFGTFALVEGRIRSVGERRQRIYLNFGRHWAEDFTIVVPRTTWKRMAVQGMDAAALTGRRIRARGILEPWQGAALTIIVPEMIERLEGTDLPR